MLRFRLFAIPFEIGTYFWIGSALLGGNVAQGPNAVTLLLIWMACVLVSLVVHELGHALAARRFGMQPAVELHALGGVTRMFGRPLTRTEGFWVTLCGPVAGWGLYLVAFGIAWVYPQRHLVDYTEAAVTPALVGQVALHFLLFINFWWTAFNLLPILPLDGGQLLRSVLGPRNLKITQGVSILLAGVLAGLAALRANWYMAVFLGFLAYSNLKGNLRPLPGGPAPDQGPGR